MQILDMVLVLVLILVKWLFVVVLARSVVLYMKMGMSVKDAVLEAVKDLRHLKTGYLDELTIHAIDNQDNHYVASFKGSELVFYWIWTDDMLEPIKKQARLIL